MKLLSSQTTWWHKRGVPVLWTIVIGLGSIYLLACVAQQQVRATVLLLPLGVATLVLIARHYLPRPLMDAVFIHEDELILSNGGREDRIPVSNVTSIELLRGRTILCLKEPSVFGSKIVFMKTLFQWPPAEENIRRAHLAEQLSSKE